MPKIRIRFALSMNVDVDQDGRPTREAMTDMIAKAQGIANGMQGEKPSITVLTPEEEPFVKADDVEPEPYRPQILGARKERPNILIPGVLSKPS